MHAYILYEITRLNAADLNRRAEIHRVVSDAHIAFFNAGGLGILIGDGQLPNYKTEKILEAYYSYALTSSTRLTFDYQFLANPAYNADRGPVNIFAGRAHWQF